MSKEKRLRQNKYSDTASRVTVPFARKVYDINWDTKLFQYIQNNTFRPETTDVFQSE